MRRATFGGALLAAAVLTACGAQDTPRSSTSVFDAKQQNEKIRQDRLRHEIADAQKQPPGPEPHTASAAPASSTSGALLTPAARASFTDLARRLGGRSGLAAASGSEVVSAGTWTTGVAWSSIKVPIAVASVRRGGADRAALRAAITSSDNAAAERLWAGLGAPPTAARTVESTLRAAGDAATTVQAVRTRPGFTAFGQTRWALASQARFAAGLPCLKGAAPVLALMGEIVADQRWGLGSAGAPARFKGGWGPDPGGRYEVRQLGLLTIGGKSVAVAIANAPADGAFATGTVNLTRIAKWVAEHVRPAAPRSC